MLGKRHLGYFKRSIVEGNIVQRHMAGGAP